MACRNQLPDSLFPLGTATKLRSGSDCRFRHSIGRRRRNIFRPRKPYDECVTTIGGMFDKAIADLPLTVPSSDLGRATKVVAQALKARMYLFAAVSIIQWQ